MRLFQILSLLGTVAIFNAACGSEENTPTATRKLTNPDPSNNTGNSTPTPSTTADFSFSRNSALVMSQPTDLSFPEDQTGFCSVDANGKSNVVWTLSPATAAGITLENAEACASRVTLGETFNPEASTKVIGRLRKSDGKLVEITYNIYKRLAPVITSPQIPYRLNDNFCMYATGDNRFNWNGDGPKMRFIKNASTNLFYFRDSPNAQSRQFAVYIVADDLTPMDLGGIETYSLKCSSPALSNQGACANACPFEIVSRTNRRVEVKFSGSPVNGSFFRIARPECWANSAGDGTPFTLSLRVSNPAGFAEKEIMTFGMEIDGPTGGSNLQACPPI